MIKANFKAYATYVTDSLNQWDLNQVLQVTGLNLTSAPEVHFSNTNTARAIVRQATLTNQVVSVGIPNSLLQDPLRIYAHIGVYEGSTFKVVELVEIPVKPRKRPEDYQIQDSDEEIYSFKALENQLANAATKAQVANIVANVGSTAELVDVRYGADGKTYASAGEAVREQFAALIGTLDGFYKLSPNLFDRQSLTAGHRANGAAEPYTYTEWGSRTVCTAQLPERLSGSLTFFFNFAPTGVYGYHAADGSYTKLFGSTSFEVTPKGLYCYTISIEESRPLDVLEFDFTTAMVNTATAMLCAGSMPDKYLPFGWYLETRSGYAVTRDEVEAVLSDFVPEYKTGETSLFFGTNCGNANAEADVGDDGHYNTAVGIGAMKANIAGDHCTAVGFQALHKQVDGDNNTALGEDTLYELTGGSLNTAVGVRVLQNLLTGHRNTVVGAGSALNMTTGSNNTIVGQNAGSDLTEENGVTLLGYWTTAANGVENATAVGRGAEAEKSNQVVLGGDNVTEVLAKGSLVVRGADGVDRRIVFAADGSCTWETIT